MAGGKKVLLSPDELSEMTGFSKGTLANWRSMGRGPGYKKFGKAIRYPVSAVNEWFENHPTMKTF